MGDEVTGQINEVTVDGFTVSSSSATAEEMEANLASEPAPPDGEPEDPKEAEAKKTKAAAQQLGKKGGEAAAKAREKAPPEPKAEAKPKGDEPPAKPAEGEATPEPKKKHEGDPRFDARARVMEATREASELRKANEQLSERLAELEGKGAGPKEPAREAKPGAAPEPKLADYETYEDWVDARADWRADQKLAKYREEQEAEARAARAV